MPDILHRFTIDAPPARVHDLIATADGLERWWTGFPNSREGSKITVSIRDRGPIAVLDVIEETPSRLVWRIVDGPADWLDTTVSFALEEREDGGTTLLFTHADWRVGDEFMAGCATNWGAYLASLKSGAERDDFAPFPAGELSRWN